MPSPKHKLCLSLLCKTAAQLEASIAAASEADLIEARLDKLPGIDLNLLRTWTRKPLVVTVRSAAEGGFWKGSNTKRMSLYKAAIAAQIDYIDVEFSQGGTLHEKLGKLGKTRLVLSHHTSEKDRETLQKILDNMFEVPAAIYKLVFTADSLPDNLIALELMEQAQLAGKPFLIHAMGEMGQVSRLLNAARGGAWSYVSSNEASATAAGQITLHNARVEYCLHRCRPPAKVLGLVGSPVQQSRGWRLHNRLIDRVARKHQPESDDQDYLYMNFPAEDFAAFWADWSPHLHGLSITAPHKENIIEFLDEQAPEVRISGVCNTVVRTAKGWKGYNTDLLAIEALLRPHREILKKGGMVVGTGATARSAIAALKRLEINPIFMVGRNVDRGHELASRYGVDFLDQNEVHYAGASVIVQTTPVGMVPYTDEYPVGSALFRKERVVLDVIYNPPETRFLSIARERGCPALSGVEMFLLQAQKQFEIFTGHPVGREVLLKAWHEVS